MLQYYERFQGDMKQVRGTPPSGRASTVEFTVSNLRLTWVAVMDAVEKLQYLERFHGDMEEVWVCLFKPCQMVQHFAANFSARPLECLVMTKSR